MHGDAGLTAHRGKTKAYDVLPSKPTTSLLDVSYRVLALLSVVWHIIMYGRAFAHKSTFAITKHFNKHIIVRTHRVAITHDKMTLTMSPRTTIDDENN